MELPAANRARPALPCPLSEPYHPHQAISAGDNQPRW